MIPLYIIAGAGVAVIALLGKRKRTPKKKASASVTQWVPIMREAHAKYPNVPISVACAIMENESGGNFDAVAWECCKKDANGRCIKGTNYAKKTKCPGNDQRYDSKRRPVMSTGAWQFLIATGESYGLRATINASDDERRDPRRATFAAFKFLSDLFRKWGGKGEKYAIAAYNAGSGGVEKAYPGLPRGGKYVKNINAKREKYRYLD